MESQKTNLTEKLQKFLDFLPEDFDLKVIEHFNKIRQGIDTSLYFMLGKYISIYYINTSIEIDFEEEIQTDDELFIEALINRFPTIEY